MARRMRSRAAARQGLARTRTHSANRQTAASRSGRSQYRRRLRLEALEDRRLLAGITVAGITVTTLADTVDFNDGVTSLREAIFAANTVPGTDTIEFAPALTANGTATILLTQGELKITDSLTIDGPGSELLTIDASGSDPTPDVKDRVGSRIFNTVPPTRPASGERLPSLQVEGLTLTGGDARSRGGAILTAGVLILIDCRVTGNSSYTGGGVSLGMIGYEANHVLGSKFVDCLFEGNVAAGYGGGIWVYDNTVVDSRGLEITNCTFVGNSAGADGGGLYVEGFRATIVINNSVFHANTARSGGGVFAGYLNGLNLTNSAVHGNVSRDDGGGIYSGGPLHIGQTSIYDNTAQRTGGGIRALSDATIESSTISGNKVLTFGSWSAFGGGGIFCTGPLVVRNSTVTGNVAGASGPGGNYSLGGGIFASQATIDHSIIANNTRGQSAKPDDLVGNPTMSHSLLGVHTGGTITEIGPNLIGTLDAPIDPLLGPLADNGGFELPDGSRILTHALLEGSPAINAGDLNAVAGEGGVPEFDQRGEPFGRIVGGRIDIGAFEFQTPTDLNLLVDTLVDESDGDYSRGDLSLREAIELANAATFAGVVDTIRFDPVLWEAGPAPILLTQGELRITDSLTINGPGAELLTIDASGNDPTPELNNGDGSRVFWIDDNQLSSLIDVTIDGMVITGGDLANMVGIALSSGGAIFMRENVVLNHMAVVGNASQRFGGAVYVEHGSLRVSESMISDNNAQYLGGGIYAYSSTLLVENSIIEINSALQVEAVSAGGGGIRARESSVSITGSLINRNISGASGGGIALQQSGLQISSSTVSGNIAKWGGGGIIAESGLIGDDRPLSIVDTTITNNTSFVQGGGILLRTSNAVISGSTITGNQVKPGDAIPARYHGGGGVAHFSGSLLIQDSILMGNSIEASADGSGGAVFSSSRLTIVGSQVLANSSSGDGGGLGLLLNTEAVIQDSVIAGNSAGAKGGGISYRWRGQQDPIAIPNARVVIEGSSIRDNVAGSDGGGIYAFGNVLVDESQVSANFAAGAAGGGIFAVGSVTLFSSTVNVNSTSIIIGQESSGGGGVYAAGEVVVDRSTVSGNSSLYGGGVFSATAVTARHSTIAENAARLDGDAIGTFGSVLLDHAIVAGFSDVIGSPNAVSVVPVTAKFSMIGRAYGTTLAESPSGAPDDNGNLIGGPAHGFIDPKLGPLADNGGFELPDGSRILTHALLPGSPAINAGDLNAVAGTDGVPEFDQRGEPFGRIVGGRIDIGAFEYQTPTDLNLLVDTLVDESDGDYSCGDLSLREAIELASASNYEGVVDTIRFDPALWAAGPATILLTQDELKITDSLAIDGPGASLLTIDASGNDPTPELHNFDGSRIFNISDGDVASLIDVSIARLTLRGGDVSQSDIGFSTGGAIRSSEDLELRELVVIENSGIEGAAVYSDAGSLVIADSRFEANQGVRSVIYVRMTSESDRFELINSVVVGNRITTLPAAIIQISGGNAVIASTMLDENLVGNQSSSWNAVSGSVIGASGTRLLVQSSSITGNQGATGIGFSIQGTLSVEDSTIALNSGRGIYLTGGVLQVRRTTIDRNDSTGIVVDSSPFGAAGAVEILESTITGNLSQGWHAGGISMVAYVPVVIRDSVISNNSLAPGVNSGGGGVRIWSESALIERSAVVGNTAKSTGLRAGGLAFAGGSLQVLDCEITDNVASLSGGGAVPNEFGTGGGIAIERGSATIAHSVVARNQTEGAGGGIAISSLDSVLVIDSTVVENSSYGGGGIATYGGVVEIVRSTVSSNVATAWLPTFFWRGDGGGILGWDVRIIDSTIEGNMAVRGGGVFGSRFTITGSTISNNAAESGGGAWMNGGTIAQATISGNTAAVGGGVFVQAATVVRHSTLTLNEVTGVGGGVFVAAGSLDLDHTIVAGNRGINPDLSGTLGTTIGARYSLIGNSAGSGLTPAPVGAPDADGNLIGGATLGTTGTTISARLGPLSDNGGPTKTHVLLANSPAINSGDPSAVAGVDGVPVHDQRGAPFTRVYGGRIDMGAVEALPAGFLPGDFSGDGVVDAADYSVWRDTVSSVSDLRGDGNGDGEVDALDYEVWKANFGAVGGRGAGSRGLGVEAKSLAAVAEVTVGAGGSASSEIVADTTEHRARGMHRIASRQLVEVIDTLRERLLDAWWAMRDRAVDDGAELDSGIEVGKPVAVAAVDVAVVELGKLGKLRSGLGG